MGKWIGTDRCDLCNIDLHQTEWFADAKTRYGGWALMCKVCHEKHSAGSKFGTGIGQKYDGKTFEKIAG